ncbi:MAG TPA: alpha-L-rhamnosidase N-terminal domain-containing protein [Pirellulales bacterium]|nr:alpha-L-rhamnosidase N-terminal domain-containing protein [Pirellulales bacterium]
MKASAVGGSSFLVVEPLAGAEPQPSTHSPQPSSNAAPYLPPALPDLSPAQWIWYPSTRCLANTFILFRRPLKLIAKPRRATGWIIADSRYRLEVNGRRIQWGPAPSDPRWPEVDPLNLTEALVEGENVLGATVLYYGHGDGTWPIGKPGFLFWLEMEYPDGRNEIVVSNAEWESHLCRAWRPGQYKRWFLRSLQEDFDARTYPYGWATADFNPNDDWLKAMPLAGSPNKSSLATTFSDYAFDVRGGAAEAPLRPRSVPLLSESRVPAKQLAESCWIKWLRSPEEYFECAPPNSFDVERRPASTPIGAAAWRVEGDPQCGAALTFEFAEQLVGFPYFSIDASEGTMVELLVQEGHEIGGAALLNTGRNSWTRFTCRAGLNHFECFDYESLRWLQLHIHHRDGPVTICDVGVRRRVYPWPQLPQIHTNEPALQRLFDASINTLNNCAQDIIVDGMGRERQQYSGDCGHQLTSIRLAMGETRSPARFLTTYSQGLTVDGYFLDCWPAYDRLARIIERELGLFHLGPILDHGVQLNFDCWRHYLDTGDLDAVREPYPRLLRFAEYLLGNIGADGLLPVEGFGIPCVWIDYQAYGQSGQMPHETQRRKQCAFNLYTAAMFKHALAPLCRTMGDIAPSEAFERVAKSLEVSTVKKYWSDEHRMFVNNLPWLADEKQFRLCDRSLATAILFDQCPRNDIAASVDALVTCPRELGLSYPANAGWRLRALAKVGRTDAVIRELRERWATMDSVTLNNTLQEGWKTRPDSSNQWSHCAVAPLYITYEELAGIRALAPGFKRVEIRPQLADLEQLELTAYTVQGPIRFEAHGPRGARDLMVDLPSTCEGELVVAADERLALEVVHRSAPFNLRCYRLPPGQITRLRLGKT